MFLDNSRILISMMIFMILNSISGEIFACSCKEQRSVKEEVRHADAVIVGTMVSKEVVLLTDTTYLQMFSFDTLMRDFPMSSITIVKYQMFVEDIYKGETSIDTVVIYSGIGGGDCGVRFEVGEKYIVYAEDETYFGQENNNFKFPKSKNTYWTFNCLRTMKLQQDEIIEIEKYAKRKQLNDYEEESLIFIEPNALPLFKDGGEMGLRNFIKENLRCPKSDECVDGKVYVEFTVDTLGRVKDIEIKKGLTTYADSEAKRIVKLLEFEPGTSFGKPIEMKLILPIIFNKE